ncbi:MAG: hypothetical protein Q9216_001095 [Gyalolechia sp. 2 TL-2023]
MASGTTTHTPAEPPGLHPDDKAALDAHFAMKDDPNYSASNNVWTKDIFEGICPKLADEIRGWQRWHMEYDTEPMRHVDAKIWDGRVDSWVNQWVLRAKYDAEPITISQRERAKHLYTYHWRMQFAEENKGALRHFPEPYVKGLKVPGPLRYPPPEKSQNTPTSK